MASNDARRNFLLDHQPDPITPVLKEILLHQVRVNSRVPVDAFLWQNMQVEIQQDMMSSLMDQIVFNFTGYVLAEKLPPKEVSKSFEFSTDVFESAWQLWKYNRRDSKLFGWIHRKWPAQTTKRTFKEKATVVLEGQYVYPEARGIAFERLGQPIRWSTYEWK